MFPINVSVIWHICMHWKKKKRWTVNNAYLWLLGIQVNFILFFSGNVCQFSTYFKENENLILYSEKKKTKNERKTEICLECTHSVGNINIWHFSDGLVRANLGNTTAVHRCSPLVLLAFLILCCPVLWKAYNNNHCWLSTSYMSAKVSVFFLMTPHSSLLEE